jgi:hypothetical protein
MTKYVAFHQGRKIAEGSRQEVARAMGEGPLVFDLETGAQIDFDPRAPEPGPGRPKLGVIAREVTLLPRHWDWLARQRGGASAALRRLVDSARKADAGATARAEAKAAVYRLLSALAGDLPGFEAAARALFADDAAGFAAHTQVWPPDIVALARARLSQGEIDLQDSL